MKPKKIVHISLTILVLLILSLIFYSKFFKKIEVTETEEPLIEKTNDEIYNSNIIKDVMYTSMDADGNQYTITCLLYTSPSPRDAESSRMPSSA